MTTNREYAESFKANASDIWQAAEDFAQDMGITHDAAERIAETVINGEGARIRKFNRGPFFGIGVSRVVREWGGAQRVERQFMFNAAGELFAINGQ